MELERPESNFLDSQVFSGLDHCDDYSVFVALFSFFLTYLSDFKEQTRKFQCVNTAWSDKTELNFM